MPIESDNFVRVATPLVTSAFFQDKPRSQSLYNIPKYAKSTSVPFGCDQLNGIEESPRNTASREFRRGSLQFEQVLKKAEGTIFGYPYDIPS